MGNMTSSSIHNIMEPVNYHCSNCMKTGKEPNIAGRFFIINLNECQCNGCNTIYPKNKIYKSYVQ